MKPPTGADCYDIIKIFFNCFYAAILKLPLSTTRFGYIAADAENEGAVQYGAYHMIRVKVETSIRIEALVYMDLNKGKFSKKFIGVLIRVVNVSRNTGTDEITTTGTASLSFNGKDYSTTLSPPDPNQDQIKEAGTIVVIGDILIPASEVSKGKTFPGLNVKGNWWNIKDDGSGATPLVYHGLAPAAQTYEHTFLPYTPNTPTKK